MTPGTQRTLRLRFVDATIVTLSAKLLQFGILGGTRSKAGARRRVKSVIEISQEGLPNFLHLCSKQSEAADSIALGETMLEHTQAGDFWVFDKGCHCRTRLLKLHQKKAFWLTPQSSQSFETERIVWQAKELKTPTTVPEEGQRDWVLTQVQVGHFANSQRTGDKGLVSMSLAQLQGWRYDHRKMEWKPLSLLINLPVREDGIHGVVQAIHIGPYTPEQLASLYRERWQVELMFKFLKQHLSYAHLISRSENGIRCMIYMSLIAALLLIWYRRLSGIDRGWRSVKFWFAENARLWTQQILDKPPEALFLSPVPP